MNIPAIVPIEASAVAALPVPMDFPASAKHASSSFADLLSQGIEQVQKQVDEADRLSRAFILDDTVAVHQVTFALEQARLSMELMLQVRGRLVEGFQQFMNMQV